uniref:Putative ovule protein n=1 Tax=Solanum chacoense TaxID=4108 RepID=A0A0V0IQB0_SOLCH
MKLHHVLSIHLSPILFLAYLYPSTHSLQPASRTPSLGHQRTSSSCPNHRNLVSRILSATKATPTFSRITSFLILSLVICPHIHLNILISATCIF